MSLIINNEPAVSNEIEIEYGVPIHVPMVDVRTIGAGGGSIATVNQGVFSSRAEKCWIVPDQFVMNGGLEPTFRCHSAWEI